MTIACLKHEGIVDSLKHRLIRVVIGGARESRHALRTVVGIKSRAQVASDDARMEDLTSDMVALLN